MSNEIPSESQLLGSEPTDIKAINNETLTWDEKSGSWIISGGHGTVDCFFYSQFVDEGEDE
jgi:hypothetical protein